MHRNSFELQLSSLIEGAGYRNVREFMEDYNKFSGEVSRFEAEVGKWERECCEWEYIQEKKKDGIGNNQDKYYKAR